MHRVLPELFLAHCLIGMVLNDCQEKCNKTYQYFYRFKRNDKLVKFCFFLYGFIIALIVEGYRIDF